MADVINGDGYSYGDGDGDGDGDGYGDGDGSGSGNGYGDGYGEHEPLLDAAFTQQFLAQHKETTALLRRNKTNKRSVKEQNV